MKRITKLDAKMDTIGDSDADKEKMPTRRDILRSIGNVKANSADDARKVRRIITKMRDKTTTDLTLDNEDMAFLEKSFEANAVGLSAWMQGQILDIIADAERVEPKLPVT